MSAGVKPLSRSFGNRTSTPPTCIAAREHGGRARVGKSRKRFKTGARSDAGTTVRHSMAGNDRKLVILQDRDMHLMRELAVMRVIDREQAKVVAGFGSTTRANARRQRIQRFARAAVAVKSLPPISSRSTSSR